MKGTHCLHSSTPERKTSWLPPLLLPPLLPCWPARSPSSPAARAASARPSCGAWRATAPPWPSPTQRAGTRRRTGRRHRGRRRPRAGLKRRCGDAAALSAAIDRPPALRPARHPGEQRRRAAPGPGRPTFSLEDFDRTIAVNVRAVFVAIQAAARHMGDGGRIVNIGSTNAERMPFAGGSVYAMSKSALTAWCRAWRATWARAASRSTTCSPARSTPT
jgi:NAD(P)-dependent dehydrogenase (short-subunit alcohol dehydrogenase family)